MPNSETDGRYNFILHSLRALQELGHDVRVLLTRPWMPAAVARVSPHWTHAAIAPKLSTPQAPLSIDLVRYPSIPRYWLSGYADAFYRIGVAAHIRQIIRAHRIDIVHAHAERAGICAVDVAKHCRVASAVTLHGISTAPQLLDSAAKRARLRRCLYEADRVVLVGEPLRSYFGPLAGREDHFRIVPNGFYVHGVSRSDRSWTTTRRFVSVANLEEGKGIDLTLTALASLDALGLTDWTFDIVGEGAERATLMALAAQLRLGTRVRFHGALAHDAAMRQMSECDVFVLPSYREAFGVAYAEAMACGLLAIGVERQGPSAFISNGQTGVLVAPRDVVSLSEAMKNTIDDPVETARIAGAGRSHVEAEFTWRRHAEKLAVVYREALNDT